MIYSISVQDRAGADVETIFAWLASRSIAGSWAWYEAWSAAAATLKRDPDCCPLAQESVAIGQPIRERLFGQVADDDIESFLQSKAITSQFCASVVLVNRP